MKWNIAIIFEVEADTVEEATMCVEDVADEAIYWTGITDCKIQPAYVEGRAEVERLRAKNDDLKRWRKR